MRDRCSARALFRSLRIELTSPTMLAASLALVATLVGFALVRRPALPTASKLLAIAGVAMIALAAAGATWLGRDRPRIAVMVDVSPSTRGASYYDRGALNARLRSLLGGEPYRVYEFADVTNEVVSTSSFTERPADRTTFLPPEADAVILFSDARFALPATAPPTYIVVDPALEAASDGAIVRLTSQGGPEIEVAVRSTDSSPRRLRLEGILPSPSLPTSEPLGVGEFVLRGRIDPDAGEVVARIDGADAWPQNDGLQLTAPQTASRERWWIAAPGATPPPQGWRFIAPQALPTLATDYLSPAVIALNDVPADAISPAAMQRLEQYVRDLGGSLLIVGGEHAFGAGGYANASLDAISPLASAAPQPTRQWVLLVDRSGSMAAPGPAPGAARTRWGVALDALSRALPTIPSTDLVSAASFAQDVRWWFRLKPAAEAARTRLDDAAPGGPTNLQAALETILAQTPADARLPTELLILSDADASIEDPRALGDRMVKANFRVHLLATGGQPTADNAVATLVRVTGGQIVREPDPAQWSRKLLDLLRAANPDAIRREPIDVRFAESTKLPARQTPLWNTTWPREGIDPVASAGERVVAAKHRVGEGEVLAVSFPLSEGEVASLAKSIEREPRDPRSRVRWTGDRQVRITIDAIDGERYLTDLTPTLQLFDESEKQSIAIPQIAPGRYELTVPAPRRSQLATVRIDDRIVDRTVVAGRYPPEFDAIGNDRDAMRELARRTGGRVIEPEDSSPIDLSRPRRRWSLVAPLSALGAAMIVIALVHWRRVG